MNVSLSWLELKFRGSELSRDLCRLPGSNELWFCENLFLTSASASDNKTFSSEKFQMVLITIEMKLESLPISPSSVVRHILTKMSKFFSSHQISQKSFETGYLVEHLEWGIHEQLRSNSRRSFKEQNYLTLLFTDSLGVHLFYLIVFIQICMTPTY